MLKRAVSIIAVIVFTSTSLPSTAYAHSEESSTPAEIFTTSSAFLISGGLGFTLLYVLVDAIVPWNWFATYMRNNAVALQ